MPACAGTTEDENGVASAGERSSIISGAPSPSEIGGATSSSVYNGDGLRTSHTVSGNTTSYNWDVASGLPVVVQDGTNTYVYGLDLISAADGSGAQTYFLYDGLGSTTDLTDGSGNTVAGYSYDVFGAIRSQTGSSRTSILPM